MNARMLFLAGLASLGFAATASAGPDAATSVTGVQGYDLVSYQNSKRPLRGNGHYLSVIDGVTYLFVDQDNKDAFDANPGQYLPAFGGFCAFGVSVSKKFVGDPEVWRIVDGTLYLNLDENIQAEWLKDVPGRIQTANTNWTKISDVDAADL